MDNRKEINDFLNSLLIEKKETFIQIFNKIDIIEYEYENFINDFLECSDEFFTNHPDVDYKDINNISFYINIIINKIFTKLKINL